MGSRGTSNFTDYSGASNSGSGGNGGSSGQDPCSKEIDTTLDDIGRGSYFLTKRLLPTQGTAANLFFNGSRIEVRDSSGLTIGLLPIKHNTLALCLKDGRNYSTRIVDSRIKPLPHVRASIKPI